MLFARLLSKIFDKKNGVILIDFQGQKYICGKPNLNNPLTLKLLKKNLNWKLILNPDLNFPEAYMRGEIEITNGSLLDFLTMIFEQIGRREINIYGYFFKKIWYAWRFITNYNLPGKSKVNAQSHYDIGGEKGERLYDLSRVGRDGSTTGRIPRGWSLPCEEQDLPHRSTLPHREAALLSSCSLLFCPRPGSRSGGRRIQ